MSRLIGPDEGSRLAYLVRGDTTMQAYRNSPVTIWVDSAGTQLADILYPDGTPVSGSVLTTDQYGMLPLFQLPDSVSVVYAEIPGGPIWPVYARTDDQLKTLGTAVAGNASAISALQPSVAAQDAATVVLPAATGGDDTVALNTVLAASAGRRVAGRPGSSYKLSAPMVIWSGTSLDMSGSTVTLLAASNCNVVQNRAVVTVRRVTDAATTSTSQTLTSATAAFTSADIGKTVVVHGAGASGALLITTIAAVTNSSTATMTVAAVTTTTGTYAAVGNRDSGISVRGGTWVRAAGNNSAANGWDRHSLRFRHVDGLTLSGLTLSTADSKYAVSLGDVTAAEVSSLTLGVFSDGVHLAGPATNVRIQRLTGTTGDDSVAITPRDWPAYDDVFGNVDILAVEDIATTSTAACVFKLLGGSPATAARRVRVRGLSGVGNNNAVIIGDDTAQANTTGGLIDVVSIENIACTAQNGQSIAYINGSNIRRLRLAGIAFDNSAATAAVVRVVPVSAATIASLTLSDIDVNALNANPIVQIDSTATVTRLLIDRVTVASSASGAVGLAVSGVITDLTLTRFTATWTGSCYVVSLTGSASTATVTRMSLSDIHVSGSGGGLLTAVTSTHVLPRVEVSNAQLNSTAWVADLNTVTELHLSNVTTITPTAGIFNIRAACALTVRGAGLNLAPGGQNINIAAGGTVTSKTLALECDLTKLQTTAWSMAYNTNAGHAAGVGPVVANGTLWKQLYTGATG